MQAYTVAVLLVGILVFILSTTSTAAIAIDCEANPQLRKFCELLVAGSSIGDRPEAFVEQQQQQKRQDVDHVFLRFGRRYGSF